SHSKRQSDHYYLYSFPTRRSSDLETFILNINKQRYIECSILQQGFVNTAQLSMLKQDNIQYCLIENAGFSSEIDTQKQLFKLNIPAQYMLKQKLSSQQRYLPDLPNLGGFINYNVYFQEDRKSVV